jgi:hypothetical protein
MPFRTKAVSAFSLILIAFAPALRFTQVLRAVVTRWISSFRTIKDMMPLWEGDR